MPRKPPPKSPRILKRQQAINPQELAAANLAIDSWQAKVRTKPLSERQEALLAMLEALDA
jgi:hypothetical protein